MTLILYWSAIISPPVWEFIHTYNDEMQDIHDTKSTVSETLLSLRPLCTSPF